MAMKVMLVEDDAFTRTALCSALEGQGFRVPVHVGSAAAALAHADSRTVDVALLDLDLGRGPTGLDLAHELRERDSSIGIVLLTSYDDPRLLDADLPGLPAGAAYLRKRDVVRISAVTDALRGAVRTPGKAQPSVSTRNQGLTDPQFAVLRLVVRGMSNAQIAEELAISVSAVEKLIRRTALALGLSAADGNTRVQLAQAYARMSGQQVPQ